MTINVIKVSQFPNGANTKLGDLVTGVRTGLNTNFNGQSTQYTPIPSVMVTTLSEQMNINSCYVTNNAGQVILTLPIEFEFGDILQIIGYGAGGWQIAQNAGQQIFVGGMPTTAGITGSLNSTSGMDSIFLKGIVPNTTLINLGGPQGNLVLI